MVKVEGQGLERIGLDFPTREIELGQSPDRQGGLLSVC